VSMSPAETAAYFLAIEAMRFCTQPETFGVFQGWLKAEDHRIGGGLEDKIDVLVPGNLHDYADRLTRALLRAVGS
jgi:hypothetical protein